jgi:hypothetical protein
MNGSISSDTARIFSIWILDDELSELTSQQLVRASSLRRIVAGEWPVALRARTS